MKYSPWLSLFSLAALGCLIPLTVKAQVTTDGTTSTTVNQDGNNFTIEQGDRIGDNLFHSFDEFSVPTGGSAAFNNLDSIANIFSRVTGGNVSDIDGLLSANGAANLFLINPNGIVFGQNARLDLGGSFFASTADSLLFEGDAEFSAVNPQAPPLLEVSIPVGARFRDNPGDIINRGNLNVEQDFTLSGGNLDLQGQLQAGRYLTLEATNTVQIRDNADNPFIAAANGELLVQGNQNIDIFALNNPNSGLFSGGDLVLRSATAVGGDAQYWSGGDFYIEQLDGNLGNLSSPYDPVIRSLGDVSFNNYLGSSLHILAGGSINIGTATIIAPEISENSTDFIQEFVKLSNGDEISIDGSLQPTLDIRAGIEATEISSSEIIGINPNLDFFVGDLTNPIDSLENPILTNDSTSADINIGTIAMAAPDGLVFLTNQYKPNTSLTGGAIQIETIQTNDGFGGFTGNSGSVYVDSRSNFTATVGINTSSGGADAGDINLIAGNEVSLSNNAFLQSGTSGIGKGGDINITTKSLSATNGAIFTTTTNGQKDAGNISITASENIFFDGIVSNGQTGGIDTSSINENATGKAGDINITTKSLSVTNGVIFASSTFGQGDAGNINIQAFDTVTFDGENQQGAVSGIISSSAGENALGNSGNINITTGSLFVKNGAALATASSGQGNAGDVNIVASDTVSFDGERISNQFPGGIFSQLGDNVTGESGNISITTNSLFIINGSVLSTSTRGSGNAGSININASKEVLFDGFIDGGDIRSRVEENATGNGGNIDITTPSLFLNNGAEITTDTFGQGNAGSITVNASEIISIQGLNDDGVLPSGISSRVESAAIGNGGEIDITTDELLLSNNGRITTSTEGKGTGGEIRINSNSLTLFNNAQINSFSLGQESAGNIEIFASEISLNNQSTINAEASSQDGGNISLLDSEIITLRGSSQINTEAGSEEAAGNGGNIIIDSDLLLAFPNENNDIIANSFEGLGGAIDITTDGIFGLEIRDELTPQSDITAFSQTDPTLNGEISINSPEVDPTTGLINLPASVGDASDQISQNPCEQGVGSEFTITGKGGLPPNVNESLNSESTQVGLIETVPSPQQKAAANNITSDNSIPEATPAMGWVFNDQGEVTLTAYSNTDTEIKRSPQAIPDSCSAPKNK